MMNGKCSQRFTPTLAIRYTDAQIEGYMMHWKNIPNRSPTPLLLFLAIMVILNEKAHWQRCMWETDTVAPFDHF